MPTIAHCLSQSAEKISAAMGSDSARLDSELLLAQVMGCERTYFFTWPEKNLSAAHFNSFQQLLQRRLNGEPIAHILGEREFWSLSLSVNNSTLIPRPDTELLVETVLNLNLSSNACILDLGTGTGAIALALASEQPAWNIVGADASSEAVILAESNRKRHQLENVCIKQSDWFSELQAEAPFDVIVSNPPYIDEDDPHLKEGDVRFEPLSALVADDQGLADIRLIADQARDFLVADGWLVLEHGYQQAEPVQEILREFGYCDVATRKDYGAQDRMTLARWK